MLVPNFSIRFILGLMCGVAIIALLVQMSLRGHSWAGALAAAIVVGAFGMLVQAGVFLLFEILGSPTRRGPKRRTQLATPAPSPSKPDDAKAKR